MHGDGLVSDRADSTVYSEVMRSVQLDVVATPGCQICRAFEDFWLSIAKDWPNVTVRKMDLTESAEAQELVKKFMVFSSPAIMFNGELFSTGGFDRQKFVAKLGELSAA